MNTRRVFALVIGTCVAVLSISGCSAQSPEPTAGGLPAISENTPVGYDRWEEMNGGPADIPEMTAMAKFYGLDSINVPTDAYVAEGLVGITQLERYCVVSFEATEGAANKGLMDLVVMSRLNEAYLILLPSLPPENVRPMLDKYRPFCNDQGELQLESETPKEAA